MNIFVRPGDTLWYYSQIFNVPLRLVVDSNPQINPQALAVGQQIKIPGYIISNYNIQPGDTLWNIAFNRGITVKAIIQVNPELNPYMLQIGQTVRVPIRVNWSIVEGKQEYDYEVMIDDINRLLTVYPFLQQRSIGQSVMGKSLPELRVGHGEKKVHVNGSFHATEWITTPVLMTFLDQYVRALTHKGAIRGLQMAPFYERTTLSLVPMVNPDGVNLVINGPPEQEPYRSQVLNINRGSADFSNWKANIRGVDLNNQYPANWEEEAAQKPDAPAPFDYPGEAPLTEPEAIAMADLTRESNFDRVLAFHTQGEVIYWGYLGLEPPEARTIVQEFQRVSGYLPIQTIESFAGYKDWFIQEWRRPGYTVELGQGVSPLPLTQFDEIYEESLGILLASLYM